MVSFRYLSSGQYPSQPDMSKVDTIVESNYDHNLVIVSFVLSINNSRSKIDRSLWWCGVEVSMGNVLPKPTFTE